MRTTFAPMAALHMRTLGPRPASIPRVAGCCLGGERRTMPPPCSRRPRATRLGRHRSCRKPRRPSSRLRFVPGTSQPQPEYPLSTDQPTKSAASSHSAVAWERSRRITYFCKSANPGNADPTSNDAAQTLAMQSDGRRPYSPPASAEPQPHRFAGSEQSDRQTEQPPGAASKSSVEKAYLSLNYSPNCRHTPRLHNRYNSLKSCRPTLVTGLWSPRAVRTEKPCRTIGFFVPDVATISGALS